MLLILIGKIDVTNQKYVPESWTVQRNHPWNRKRRLQKIFFHERNNQGLCLQRLLGHLGSVNFISWLDNFFHTWALMQPAQIHTNALIPRLPPDVTHSDKSWTRGFKSIWRPLEFISLSWSLSSVFNFAKALHLVTESSALLSLPLPTTLYPSPLLAISSLSCYLKLQ